jgi:hypothetical protein
MSELRKRFEKETGKKVDTTASFPCLNSECDCIEEIDMVNNEYTIWLENLANDVSTTESGLHLNIVINWVAVGDKLPDSALGSYLVCLENNAVMILEYSNITNKWWHLAMGDIKKNNPVKYWSELPEPPCL